jgi:hypothetical protein
MLLTKYLYLRRLYGDIKQYFDTCVYNTDYTESLLVIVHLTKHDTCMHRIVERGEP